MPHQHRYEPVQTPRQYQQAWLTCERPGLPPLRIPVASTRPGPPCRAALPDPLAVPICEPRSAPLVHRPAPRRPLLLLFDPSPASPSRLSPGPSRSPSHRGADVHICRSPSRAAPLSSVRRRSSVSCGVRFKVRPSPLSPIMLLALLVVVFVLSFAGSGYACLVASGHGVFCADMTHSFWHSLPVDMLR
jgi:hypothetical protein